MDYPKSVPSVGLVNGKFVDENPVTGQVGSLISSEWGNAVTDELLNVIRAGGKVPAEAEHDQLLAAIKAIVRDSIPPEKIRSTLAEYGITDAYTKSVTYTKAEIEALLKNMSALPVGAMVPFPKGTVPPGFLEVDGSVQSAATYPDLAAYLGTTFNTGGEGVGNFRLPESRGEFLRGWDHGRGVDTGRVIGSRQAATIVSAGDGTRTSAAVVAFYNNADESLEGNKSRLNSDGTPPLPITGVSDIYAGTTGSDVIAYSAMYVRPRNLAVMWCIKAWNAPTNQGNIDVAALAVDVRNAQKNAVVGICKALKVSASGLSSIVNVMADQLVVGNDLSFKTLGDVNLTINATAMGANGLDTGLLTGSTWYSVWVIWGGAGVAGLLSLSEKAPVLPVGYTHKARVSWTRTDPTANKFLLSFIQAGNSVQYKVVPGSNVQNLPVMASGVVSPAADVSVSAFVPPTAAKISLTAGTNNGYVGFAPSSAYTAQALIYLNTATLNAAPFVGGYNPSSPVPTANGLFLLEGPTIRFGSFAATGVLQCIGWEDNL
ncbi:phage tail protein [Pseudomonas sp. Au-Pse12]|uniref:phage tail protein n=1 Tax=Pseudomonas sp. Au-Pse12 TaxID=2906459 RepID=UPI001E55846A|nr:phage tail protein [Pseudomonas sp. Au-Pse12]MCE4053469.1 tail fiber protein [Pseudomonas sp. Au-Pse12]